MKHYYVFVFLQVGWTGESADTATAWLLELYWGAEMSEIRGEKRNKNCKLHFWKLRPEICSDPYITWAASRLWRWSGEGVSERSFSDTFLICIGRVEILKYLFLWMFVIYFLKLCLHSRICMPTILCNCLFKYLLSLCYLLNFILLDMIIKKPKHGCMLRIDPYT